MSRSGIGPKGGGQDAWSQTGVAGQHRGDDTTNNGEMAERFKAPVLTALQEQREQCRVAALARRAEGRMPGVKPASPASTGATTQRITERWPSGLRHRS